jgi:nucleoside-diphosphate-sugar epimerase
MRVFVAGATGALGVPLVRLLVAGGHEVVGLTRAESKSAQVEALGARAAVANALDEASIAGAVREAAPDVVVHALTALPTGGPSKAKDLDATNEVRTRGTRNLVRAAIGAGARRIVGESIVLAYGQAVDGLVTEETHRATRAPSPELQPTTDAIVTLEDALLGAAPKIEPIVLRYGFFYGGDTGSTHRLVAMLKKRRLPLFGPEDGAIPWIHIDDAARATLLAIERGAPGAIYNVCDDRPCALRTFVESFASAIGAPRPIRIPLWLVRLLMPYAANAATTRLRVSNAKAKEELGWKLDYPTVREGLAHVAAAIDSGKNGG